MRSEREKGGNPAPGDSKGHSPWRAFGDFPRVGKVTRGGGAERPPHRGVQRGAAPPRIVRPGVGEAERPPHWEQELPSRKNPRVKGRSALHLRDCAPRIKTKTILDSSAGLRYTEKKRK